MRVGAKMFFGMSLMTILAGCVSPTEPMSDVFHGYKVMALPRSSVGIGGQWQQGIGDSVGAPLEDLRIANSFSNVDINTGLGAGIAASLYSTLNLSGALKTRSAIKLNEVEIVKLANINNLKISSDSQVLYEAVRVKSFSINTTSDYSSELRSAVLQKFGNSEVYGVADGSNTVTVDGANVFVAYKVISLGKPKVRRYKDDLPQARVGDYEVEVYADAAFNCMCPRDAEGRFVVGRGPVRGVYDRCLADHPLNVHIENLRIGSAGGGGYVRKFRHKWGASGSIPLDAREQNGRIEVDRIRIEASISSGVQGSCGPWELLDSEYSQVELAVITYPFKILANPYAPGW